MCCDVRKSYISKGQTPVQQMVVSDINRLGKLCMDIPEERKSSQVRVYSTATIAVVAMGRVDGVAEHGTGSVTFLVADRQESGLIFSCGLTVYAMVASFLFSTSSMQRLLQAVWQPHVCQHGCAVARILY